jgi:hypothetical protein
MQELVFTITSMALATHMAYFHYNFYCCISVLLVLIHVHRYCGNFIFFTEEPFIMFIFIVFRIGGLLQSKHPVVTIAICTALFQFWCMYCKFFVKMLAYKKETRCYVYVVLRVACREIIWLVPEISPGIYSNIMKFNRIVFSNFIFKPP